MKTQIAFVFAFIFLIGIVSSASFDNVKTKVDIQKGDSLTFDGKQIAYNDLWDKYKPIKIDNAFGLGSTLFEGYIEKHDEICGTECSSEFVIRTYQDSVLVSALDFYTIIGNERVKQDVRSYQLSYWGEVLDYETQCVDLETITDKNGTKYTPQECNQIQIGSHEGLVNYNIGEIKPAGEYKFKLDANKKPSRTVDWVITTQGKVLNEWAVWGNISLGDDAEVILNSPADASTSLTTLITFNASANVTGGATLTNMSLYTNETGSWGLRNTTDLGAGGSSFVTITDTFASSTPAQASSRGQNITLSTGVNGLIIVKNSTATPLHAILRWANNTYINYSNFSGNNATILTSLSAGNYLIVFDSNGAGFNDVYSGGVSYPITGTNISVTNGIYCDSNGFGANTCHQDTGFKHNLIGVYSTGGLTNSTQTWNNTYSSGTILWNVQACDSDGDCGFATSNYTFSIDSSAPSIFLNGGNGTQNYGTLSTNHTINYTITDSNLASCLLQYSGTNRTIPCTSGVMNTTNFTLQLGTYSAIIFANDSAGNWGSQSFSWSYNIFEGATIYENPVYETQITSFAINLTYNSSNSLIVTLNYDGTNYTTTNTGTGNNGYFTSANFNIPLVNTSQNKTFYWILNYNSAITTTQLTNQTVNPLIIINCNATYTVKTLNFTFYEEQLQANLNATLNKTTFLFNIKYWLGDGSVKKELAFQNLTSTQNNYQFCIGANLSYYADVDLQYFAEAYAERTFYLRNASLTNTTQDYLLYNLLITEATKFAITVRQGTEVFPDALVNIYKYYTGLNLYNLVMVGLTDDRGRFTANLDLDQTYNMSVVRNNTNYGNFDKQTTCLASPCEIELNIEELTLNPLDPFYNYFAQNVDYNLTYNETTQILTLNFVDNTGTAQYWRLLVTKDYLNNDTSVTICDTQVFSPSGSITCNYTGFDGDLNARVYISRSPEKLVTFFNWLNSLDYKTFGISAILVSIIIILVIFFTGIRNPVNALVLIPFGLIILKFLQFLPLKWSSIAGVTVLIFWIVSKIKT